MDTKISTDINLDPKSKDPLYQEKPVVHGALYGVVIDKRPIYRAPGDGRTSGMAPHLDFRYPQTFLLFIDNDVDPKQAIAKHFIGSNAVPDEEAFNHLYKIKSYIRLTSDIQRDGEFYKFMKNYRADGSPVYMDCVEYDKE